MAITRRTWSVGLWAVGLTVLAVGLHWGWVQAWLDYPDLSEEQRTQQFNAAFVERPRRAMAARLDGARLDGGAMAILARSDIAHVGDSRCIRESRCVESFIEGNRRSVGCSKVIVGFDCAYAVRTTDGNAGTAFVQISGYPDSRKPLRVEEPSFRAANDMSCKLGLGCKPAAGTQPGWHAAASAAKGAEPASPPSSGAQSCKGVRAEVVGNGETCLDPADPARRDFRDCNDGFCGPAMVALPTGRGLRGSSDADMARLSKDDPRAESFGSETPQREVTIGYQLAVGKFEVTFDEWDSCLADGGCKRRPEDPGDRTRGTRPVMHVSWIEVRDEFLPWLNRKLGLSGASVYRLLTEAEWEYAARARTTTKYAFGDIISTAQANFYGERPPKVGSFAPNGFGLHDMHGSVPEWVEDCYTNGYDAVPVDGSAHSPEKCTSRVHRGGAWNDVPVFVRSAHRGVGDPKDRNWKGFRVARTLVVH
jgi:formylglycine-generating enzyme required for sulfatase activity